ncbi:unnamed protein product [Nippostrongylus brasiliensis]|uniref:guanylate cyclase n=1 Tax=Nippostrongylus brasiliensis TaxID=27835 RepID=A0A158R340_NIPBR|nr:unnamed protein product [Nippostrongylus brasiliensis]
MYAVALNSTLSSNSTNSSSLKQGLLIAKHYGMRFKGIADELVIAPSGIRYPTFYFDSVDEEGNVTTYATIHVENMEGTFTMHYDDEKVLWWKRGQRPPAVPKCGFDGLQGKAENSVRSLRSTTNSGITKRDVIAERRNFTFFILDMRQFDQENLNRFIGLCSNGPQMLSLWKYCSRGSIDDVIENNAAKMDSFFAISFMKDIASAIAFLHESQLQVHGFLTSKNCLVSERWQVKVSDYGLDRRLLGDKLPTEGCFAFAERAFFKTPLVIEKLNIEPFAIVSAQLLTKTKAWDLAHRKEDPDEIIYMVKKGGYNALRPDLETEPTEDTAPALLHLVRDCWAERPSERPEINQVRHELRSMKRSGAANELLDRVGGYQSEKRGEMIIKLNRSVPEADKFYMKRQGSIMRGFTTAEKIRSLKKATSRRNRGALRKVY